MYLFFCDFCNSYIVYWKNGYILGIFIDVDSLIKDDLE